MPDETPEGPQPPLLEIKGDLCFVLFDGVLSGPAPEPQSLRRAVDAFNESSAVRADIDIDVGRFSVLLDDQPIPAKAMTEETQVAINDLLSEVIAIASARGEVESTLRCTEVFSESVRESLFATRNNETDLVSRIRPVTHEDLRRGPVPAALLPAGMSRRRASVIFLCLMLAAVGVAWKAGYIDRLNAADAGALEFDGGVFEDYIACSFSSSWGNYEVKLTKGQGYPDKADNTDDLSAGTRAARSRVQSGSTCYLILENEDGRALGFQEVDLSKLLQDQPINLKLPGHPEATRARLSLSPPEK